MTPFNQKYDIQSNAVPQALQHYPFISTQVVAWGDMDAFGHVNNVVFYRYAETARLGYLTHLNLFRADLITVLAHSSCTYLSPVVYPDILLIGARSKKLGNTSVTMEYAFFSTAQEQVVATGEAVLVRLNKANTDKVALTEPERQSVLEFEQTVDHQPKT